MTATHMKESCLRLEVPTTKLEKNANTKGNFTFIPGVQKFNIGDESTEKSENKR